MPRSSDKLTSLANDKQLKVKLEFTDVEILKVCDIYHIITMKLHLGVHWNEPRLVSLNTHSQENQVPLDINLVDYLWLPDLDVYNIKHIKEFKVLKKIAGINVEISLFVRKQHLSTKYFEILTYF